MKFRSLLFCLLLLPAASQADDWAGFGRAMEINREGIALAIKGQVAEAIEKEEQALQLLSTLDISSTTLRTQVDFALKTLRTYVATLHQSIGREQQGLNLLLPQYEQFRESGAEPTEESIELVKNIASSFLGNADYAQSLNYASIGLNDVEKIRTVPPMLKVDLLDISARAILFLGRVDEAVTRFSESQRLYETVGLRENFAARISATANAYRIAGQFARAEAAYLKALEHYHQPFVLQNNLGHLYMEMGEFAKAREMLKRSIANAEKANGVNYRGFGTVLGNLTSSEMALGLYASEVPQRQRALALNETQFGPDSTEAAVSLQLLAHAYMNQGDLATAETLYQRALENHLRHRGELDEKVAEIYLSLAALNIRRDRSDQAIEMAQRALHSSEKRLGKANPRHARNLITVSSIEIRAGQPESALEHARDALSVLKKTYGDSGYHVASAKYILARALIRTGQHAEALSLLHQSLPVMTDAVYASNSATLLGLSEYAVVALASGQRDAALQSVSRLVEGARQRATKGEEEAKGDRGTIRESLFNGLRVMHAVKGSDNTLSEAFEIAQLARASDAADALKQMSVRFSASENEIARLIRERQDAMARYQALLQSVTNQASKIPAAPAALVQALHADVERARQNLVSQDAQIALRYPQYSQLIEGRPQSVTSVRAALEPDEALVSFVMAGDLRPRFELPASHAPMSQVYAWIIRRDGGSWLRLDTSQAELEKLVGEVRQSTDLSGSNLKPFATGAAYALYQKLFAPMKPQLAGVRRLVIVPDGPLTSLPFPALLTAPAAAPAKVSGYRKLPWLAESYSLNLLPSESSLVALRSNVRVSNAPRAMAGFGDPLFQGTASVQRNIKSASFYSPDAASRGAAVSIDSVRKLSRLPETADELRQIAKILKADEQSLFLQQRATEETVKSIDLTAYRMISFATHGLMAGEFSGISEPGLALTPPAADDSSSDGFLSSSEAAQLKLNADWVVLSACNTASPDGKPGASGLSGLSAAFLYAGARSVLVSHWAVDSEATVSLMSKLFAYSAQGLSKAESHRKAMLSLKNDSNNADYAHPAFWAPFIVIGEGK